MRELENMVQRAIILAEPGGGIDVQHLFAGGEKLRASSFNLNVHGALVPSVAQPGLDPGENQRRLADELLESLQSFEQIETLLVQRAMERAGGNLSAAARLLRLRRGQMEYRLKKREENASGG